MFAFLSTAPVNLREALVTCCLALVRSCFLSSTTLMIKDHTHQKYHLADNSNNEIQTHRWLTTWSWYTLTYETNVEVIHRQLAIRSEQNLTLLNSKTTWKHTLNLPVGWQLGANRIWRYWIRRELENTLSISRLAGNLERTEFEVRNSKTTWKYTFNLPVGWQLEDYPNNVLL